MRASVSLAVALLTSLAGCTYPHLIDDGRVDEAYLTRVAEGTAKVSSYSLGAPVPYEVVDARQVTRLMKRLGPAREEAESRLAALEAFGFYPSQFSMAEDGASSFVLRLQVGDEADPAVELGADDGLEEGARPVGLQRVDVPRDDPVEELLHLLLRDVEHRRGKPLEVVGRRLGPGDRRRELAARRFGEVELVEERGPGPDLGRAGSGRRSASPRSIAHPAHETREALRNPALADLRDEVVDGHRRAQHGVGHLAQGRDGEAGTSKAHGPLAPPGAARG
jgi:hypothetical protein